jgi:hypothetical protein
LDQEEEEQWEFLRRESEEFDEATLASTHLSVNYNDLLRGEFQGRPVIRKIAKHDLDDTTFYLREKLVDFAKHFVYFDWHSIQRTSCYIGNNGKLPWRDSTLSKSRSGRKDGCTSVWTVIISNSTWFYVEQLKAYQDRQYYTQWSILGVEETMFERIARQGKLKHLDKSDENLLHEQRSGKWYWTIFTFLFSDGCQN